MRQWLRDHGREPPARGPVSQADREFYEQHAGSLFTEPGDPLDGGVTDADFDGTAEEEPSVPLQPERAPRTPRPRSARQRAGRGALRLLAGTRDDDQAKGKKSTGAKRKPPRVSLEKLAGRMWEGLGRVLGSMSPATGNCMQIQAPVAGMILEDVVAGTLIDRPLQPLARAEVKAEKAAALFLPPLCVLGIEHAQTLDPKEAAIRTALLMPVLREGLGLWIDVAGDKVEAAAERKREWAEKRRLVDEMVAAIFAQPVATVEQEEPVPA